MLAAVNTTAWSVSSTDSAGSVIVATVCAASKVIVVPVGSGFPATV